MVAGVLLIAFVIIQVLLPETATVPPRIITSSRTMAAATFLTFCMGAHMMIMVYFLPIWFQAIQGSSAFQSGLKTLPLTLSLIIGGIASGGVISKTGPYLPSLFTGVLLTVAGAALLMTLKPDSPSKEWIGYQVLYGFGLGFSFQVPNIAAQTVLPHRDVPVGTALVIFGQQLGGSVFVSIGQSVFSSELLKRLSGIEGFETDVLRNTGATTLAGSVPAELRDQVLNGYNEALSRVFMVGLIVACVAVLFALCMEWRSVKEKQKNGEKGVRGEDKAEEKKVGNKTAGKTPSTKGEV